MSERDKKIIERRLAMRKIKARLVEQDIRLKEVAAQAGVTVDAVSKTLAGLLVSKRILQTIERMLTEKAA